MEDRSIAIIAGVTLLLALLSPFVIENRGKIDKLYTEAEAFYSRSNYITAIEKYNAVKKESKKLFTKTDHIDRDFQTHINIKIARCYYALGNTTQDQIYYAKSLNIIDKNLVKAKAHKHIGELQYIKAMIYYKIGNFDLALANLVKIEKIHENFEWHHDIIYAIGDIYIQRENFENALEYFQELIELYPSSEYCITANNHIDEINKKLEPDPKPGPKPKPIPPWEKEAKQILDAANVLKEQTKTDEAMEQYSMLIEQYPDSQFVTFAYEGIGEIFSSEKNYLDARANYEEAIYSTSDEIRRNSLYEKYHQTFLKPDIPPIPPDPSKELLVDAILLRESGRFIEAAKQFMKLVDMEETYEEKVYAFSEASFCYYKAYEKNETHYDRSVNALRKLIENYSESKYTIYAYYYLTKVYSNKMQFQSVINTVKWVEEEFANSGEQLTQDLLGHLKKLKDRAKEKINGKTPPELKRNEPEPRPRKPEAKLVEQGYAHLNDKALEKALDKAEEALKINPEYQRAKQLKTVVRNQYFEKGKNNLSDSKYENAVKDFRKVLNIDPDTAYAYCNIGVAYIYMERYNDAIIELKSALMIDMKIKEVYFNLALAYYELKKYNDANREIKRALEMDSEYENAIILMESINKELK